MDYDDDFMSRAMSNHDPPDLWISTPDDQFPDPNLDAEGFMIYCGESFPRLTTSLWLVTREMVEKGEELKPIAIHEPFIFSKLVKLFKKAKKPSEVDFYNCAFSNAHLYSLTGSSS